mmetsp:Transcript_404/g.775  ORF Transcript_404/g.775 Transcript_404/m.775 type:complete len:235 (-) Transcript_404:302-1006(-)
MVGHEACDDPAGHECLGTMRPTVVFTSRTVKAAKNETKKATLHQFLACHKALSTMVHGHHVWRVTGQVVPDGCCKVQRRERPRKNRGNLKYVLHIGWHRFKLRDDPAYCRRTNPICIVKLADIGMHMLLAVDNESTCPPHVANDLLHLPGPICHTTKPPNQSLGKNLVTLVIVGLQLNCVASLHRWPAHIQTQLRIIPNFLVIERPQLNDTMLPIKVIADMLLPAGNQHDQAVL